MIDQTFYPGMPTTRYVIEALERSGYSDLRILKARFLKISESTGDEIHIIHYWNDDIGDGEMEAAKVYIKDGKGEF